MMHMDLHFGYPAGSRVGHSRQPGPPLLLQLLHPVQGTACAEPLDLSLVEGVVQEDGFLGPIRVLDDAFQRLQRKDGCGWEVERAPGNSAPTTPTRDTPGLSALLPSP